MFKLDIKVDLEGPLKAVRSTKHFLREISKRWVDLGEEAFVLVKERTPKKTGETADKWEIKVYDGTGAIVISNESDVIDYLEYGTPPHVIVPKKAGGVLAFSIGGEQIFTTIVYHPGTAPLGFVEKTQDDIAKKAMELMTYMDRGLSLIWQ